MHWGLAVTRGALGLAWVVLPMAAWAAAPAGPAARPGAVPAGRIVVAQGVDATTLDPHNHEEAPAYNVLQNIYETLLERDAHLKIVPLLAESYRAINPTTWEFKIRRGIRFHNGEPLDAAAVKFSLDRLLDPALKAKQAPNFKLIERVEVRDPATVRIITSSPHPTLDAQLAIRGDIVPPRYFRAHDAGHLARNPVGTGPYTFVRWRKDEEIVLEANPAYWRGAPPVRTVLFKPIPETATRVAALQTGEVDIAVNIPPHLVATLQQDRRVRVSRAGSVRTLFIPIYTVKDGKPIAHPVGDPRVRRAMLQALDVDAIVRDVLEGQGVRIASMLTERHFGFDAGLKPPPHDPERARRLLAEAGYPNGVDLVLNSPDGRYIKDKEVAEAVAGQLSKTGLRTVVRTFEWATYLNTMVYVHAADPMYLIGWGNTAWDADRTYTPFLHAGEVFANYANPAMDRLLDEAQVSMSPKRRRELYARAARLIQEDVPVLPLYQQVDLYGVSRRVEWEARPDERLEMRTVKWTPGLEERR
jgi:peptide/nickel transport system substrate-binding protein